MGHRRYVYHKHREIRDRKTHIHIRTHKKRPPLHHGSALTCILALGTCRGVAVLIARICLESARRHTISIDQRPSTSWLDPSVVILQRACTAMEGNALANVQGLYIILCLFDMFDGKNMEPKCVQIFAALNSLFSPSQPPEVSPSTISFWHFFRVDDAFDHRLCYEMLLDD